MTPLLSDDFLRFIQACNVRCIQGEQERYEAALRVVKQGFEHDRRSLAQRLRRDRLHNNHRKGK